MTRYAPTRSLVNSTPDFPNGLTFSNGLTSNSGEVLLTQNSDQYGTNLLRMQNRTGTNGIILDASLAQSGIDLMDMAFRSAHTTYGLQQQQIRMEGRSSALARTGGYGNEIQIGTGVRFCKPGGFIGPTAGLVATLVAGSFTVVLTTGSTATLVVGQGFSKTAGSGVLGAGIITEIDPANTTTFTVSVAHVTLGAITFTAVAPNHTIESMGTSSSNDFNTWLGTSGVTYAVGTSITPTSNGSTLGGSGSILKYFPSHWHMVINSGGTTIRGGTASTSTTTGTLVVGGGVGISGSANVGGSLTLGNNNSLSWIDPAGTSRRIALVSGIGHIYYGDIDNAISATNLYINTNNIAYLRTNNIDRLSINSSGVIIIGSGEGTATLAGNILRGPSAVGTDIAGGSLTIAGGASTGSGLGGSIIFQTASAGSAGTAVNTLVERMRIITSGNVGIGTTTPAAKLEIAHDGASTWGVVLQLKTTAGTDGPRSAFEYYNGGTPKRWNIGIRNSSTAFGIFEDGGIAQGFGTERVTVLAGGNVGIGTTSPNFGLHIQGFDATALMIERTANNTTSSDTYTRGLYIRSGTSTSDWGIAGTAYTDANYTNKAWWTSTGKIAFGAGGRVPSDLIIDTNGRVGIGTGTPGYALDVVGTAKVSTSILLGTQGGTIDEYTTGNQALRIYSNTAGKSLWIGFAGGITLNNNTSVTGTLSTTGNVGIGKSAYGSITTDGVWFATGDLTHMSATTSNGAFYVNQNGTGPIVSFNKSGVEKFGISNAGNASVAGSIATTGTVFIQGAAGTNPGLEIYSNGGTSGSNIALSQGYSSATDQIAFLWNRANTAFHFGTAGSTKMTLLPSGNIGIGTTSPTSTLHVVAPNTSDIEARFTGGNTQGIAIQNGTLWEYRVDADTGEIGFNYYGYNSGTTRFRNTSIYNGKNGRIAFFQGSTGYLGIGSVATPAAELHIKPNVWGGLFMERRGDSATVSGVMYFDTSTSGNPAIRAQNGNFQLYTGATINSTMGTESLTVLANGNVGIGTGSPGYKLEVSGEGRFSSNIRVAGVTVDMDAVSNANVVLGNVGDGSGWSAQGIGMTSGSVGHVATIGSANGTVYFGMQNGTAVDSLATYMQHVGSTRYTFFNAGNVGIGTATPAYYLTVQKTDTSNVISSVQNLSNGSSAYTAMWVGNDTHANRLVMFTNSSTRTADGGVGTSTIRTDNGNLRIGTAGTLQFNLAVAPTVGQVLAATDTSGTLGWSSGTTYYRQFMFTS